MKPEGLKPKPLIMWKALDRKGTAIFRWQALNKTLFTFILLWRSRKKGRDGKLSPMLYTLVDCQFEKIKVANSNLICNIYKRSDIRTYTSLNFKQVMVLVCINQKIFYKILSICKDKESRPSLTFDSPRTTERNNRMIGYILLFEPHSALTRNQMDR